MSNPGQLLSAELLHGKTDVLLVIAACAVILGVLLVWSFVKRAAGNSGSDVTLGEWMKTGGDETSSYTRNWWD